MLKIKEMRRAIGMSQYVLAGKLNVTQGAVSSWENGRCFPTIDKLWQMARLFGCTVDELISG